MQIQQQISKHNLDSYKRKMYAKFHTINFEQVNLDTSIKDLLVEGRYGAQTYGKRPDENFNQIILEKTITSTGVGSDPYDAFKNAIVLIDKRRMKRGAHLISLDSGFVMKNGANYYYTLSATVFKMKS